MKISEENKPVALVALYNAARPQGRGWMEAEAEGDLTLEAAQMLLEFASRVDYAGGRSIKVDFSGEELDFRLFDRDNGQGAGERAVRAALGGGS